MRSIIHRLKTLAYDETGVSLVEWVLMIAMVGGVVLTAMIAYNTGLDGAFAGLTDCITTPTAANCPAPQ